MALYVSDLAKARAFYKDFLGFEEHELVERAKSSPRVQSYLDGDKIRQTIVVPRKLVNIVTE